LLLYINSTNAAESTGHCLGFSVSLKIGVKLLAPWGKLARMVVETMWIWSTKSHALGILRNGVSSPVDDGVSTDACYLDRGPNWEPAFWPEWICAWLHVSGGVSRLPDKEPRPGAASPGTGTPRAKTCIIFVT